ncbi:MAG: hypothetical protein FWG98_02570 [Candidatus Cloacimonetes bacterium]|nr:hypothetical protein [Candidatus Cloacimonadota bacterium]
MKYVNLREEELKNLVAKDFFEGLDCSAIIKDIDFAVASTVTTASLPLFEDNTVGVKLAPTRNNNWQPQGLPLQFSDRAKEVFKAGKELWRYYHSQVPSTFQLTKKNEIESSRYDVNASFYDIRGYFQDRNASGRMNSHSDDEMYNKLLAELNLELIFLTKQIEPKIYKYGFLK